jgi:hypothetical protein
MTIRREQLREAITRHRKRRKHGFLWRPILVTKSQLDQLEERGYLDPNRRGERLDERLACITPLLSSLAPATALRRIDVVRTRAVFESLGFKEDWEAINDA